MDIQSVGNIYQKLNKANLHLLKDVYHQDVVFEDAAHRLEGWPALSDYFTSLYANVISCDFVIHEHQQVGDTGFLTWTMDLQHPKLQKVHLFSLMVCRILNSAKAKLFITEITLISEKCFTKTYLYLAQS